MTHEGLKQAKQFIAQDIFREVQLARASDNPETRPLLEAAGIKIGGAGNYLCALALLCYTDFLARVRSPKKNGEQAFVRLLPLLAPDYVALHREHPDVYDLVRGGMVHNYYAKHPFGVIVYHPTIASGIVYRQEPFPHFYIAVDRFAHDLIKAFDAVEQELFGEVTHIDLPGIT